MLARTVYIHLLGLDFAFNLIEWGNRQLDKLEDWAYRVGTTVDLRDLDLSEEDLV